MTLDIICVRMMVWMAPTTRKCTYIMLFFWLFASLWWRGVYRGKYRDHIQACTSLLSTSYELSPKALCTGYVWVVVAQHIMFLWTPQLPHSQQRLHVHGSTWMAQYYVKPESVYIKGNKPQTVLFLQMYIYQWHIMKMSSIRGAVWFRCI